MMVKGDLSIPLNGSRLLMRRLAIEQLKALRLYDNRVMFGE